MIEEIERWTVAKTTQHTRLDHYLTQRFPDRSRSQIQTWIRQGRVRVNGAVVKTGYLLKPDDELTLEGPPQAPPDAPRPEPIPLDIIYDDNDLAVIDKPAGMVCHVGAGVHHGTLVNALLYHFGSFESEDPNRPGIVHRLDKLTSGVMVVAKNNWTHRALAEQFKKREVEKEYLALVYGHPVPTEGTIDWPLGRDSKDRKKISIRARKRRSAVTHYRVERAYGPFSLLRVRIETGRTHQIRVHLAQQGYPVVGDTVYGRYRGSPRTPLQQTVTLLGRHFLHACSIKFRHPRTQQPMAFTAPLPAALNHFLVQFE